MGGCNDDRRSRHRSGESSGVLNLDFASVAQQERIAALRSALRRARAEQRQGLDRAGTVALLVHWLSDEQVAA